MATRSPSCLTDAEQDSCWKIVDFMYFFKSTARFLPCVPLSEEEFFYVLMTMSPCPSRETYGHANTSRHFISHRRGPLNFPLYNCSEKEKNTKFASIGQAEQIAFHLPFFVLIS